ncbi:cytochrome P450 [Punctularia strigosozonata HHB-11173 SS5]|uniref:cytochrome P450 n=1 Tax=Punctularia strigosozonata (strain HHB-11173) TaxID=741275 RepID=UPI0004417AC4|nr:cytochrome P450 [Punctularia strigosozonata HHB-11173 SS5]EIN06160.1 cytochrome P450 [Punctularia strigosozonata HHB-11173 SS5]
MITVLDATVGVLAIYISYRLFKQNLRALPRPPGPKGYPIVGNSLQIPSNHPWERYMEWAKQYNSDIIRLIAPGSEIIIVSSMDKAVDLFEKRSAIFSDRPYLPMICGLIELSRWNLALMPYGDLWRDTRKGFHRYLGSQEMTSVRPKVLEYNHKLLRKLLSEPAEFLAHARAAPGALILNVAYGFKIADSDDPWLHLVDSANEGLIAAAIPGAFLVDLLPFLRWVPAWFPGAGFQRTARELRKLNADVYTLPYEDVKRQILHKGSAPESVTQAMLSGLDVTNITEYEEHCVPGIMFSAGADTTVASLKTFLLAMIMYPDVQQRAQDEIDVVLHGERLPNFDDMSTMPYTTALMKEVLRWHSPTPLGVARKNTEDDVYDGCFIAKGSIVIPNVWAISRDPKFYPGDPDSFRPSRFLDASGQLDPSVLDPTEFFFGFGRRICPGRYLAQDSMWIMMSSILAVFKISRRKEDIGVNLERYTTGIIISPEPFECIIEPRSPQAEQLILAQVEAL